MVNGDSLSSFFFVEANACSRCDSTLNAAKTCSSASPDPVPEFTRVGFCFGRHSISGSFTKTCIESKSTLLSRTKAFKIWKECKRSAPFRPGCGAIILSIWGSNRNGMSSGIGSKKEAEQKCDQSRSVSMKNRCRAASSCRDDDHRFQANSPLCL